jgi:hypothetical protein
VAAAMSMVVIGPGTGARPVQGAVRQCATW